jgi:hypothetical protein
MRFVLLALALAAASGCTQVRPYQRELLAQPGMIFEADPDTELRQHWLEAREASAGGFGSRGGGCGCN